MLIGRIGRFIRARENGWFTAWRADDWPRLTLRDYDAGGVEVLASIDW